MICLGMGLYHWLSGKRRRGEILDGICELIHSYVQLMVDCHELFESVKIRIGICSSSSSRAWQQQETCCNEGRFGILRESGVKFVIRSTVE